MLSVSATLEKQKQPTNRRQATGTVPRQSRCRRTQNGGDPSRWHGYKGDSIELARACLTSYSRSKTKGKRASRLQLCGRQEELWPSAQRDGEMRRGTSGAKSMHADRITVQSKALRRIYIYIYIDGSKARQYRNESQDTTANAPRPPDDLYRKEERHKQNTPAHVSTRSGLDQRKKEEVRYETQEGDAQTPVSMMITHSTDGMHVRARPQLDERTDYTKKTSGSVIPTRQRRRKGSRATERVLSCMGTHTHVFLSLLLWFCCCCFSTPAYTTRARPRERES